MLSGNIKNIDLNLLKVLDELLRQGSVTQAGEVMGLSQPAISRALGRLRILFDEPLFVRAGRKLVPTPFALQMQEPLAKILDETKLLVGPRHFDPATAQDIIQINAPDATTLVVLSEVFSIISHTAPGLKFVVSNVSEGRFEGLKKGEIDLAIDFFDKIPAEFYRQPLLRDRMVYLARQGHPITKKRKLKIDDCFDWPHIRQATASTRLVEDMLGRRDIYPDYALTVPNFIVGASAAAGTDWLMMIINTLGRYTQRLYALDIVEVPFEIADIGLDLVWHERFDRDPCHTWVRRQIINTCQDNFASLQSHQDS